MKKYLCKNCGWFVVMKDTGEWSDAMGNEVCITETTSHQPTGTGVEVDEKLRVR